MSNIQYNAKTIINKFFDEDKEICPYQKRCVNFIGQTKEGKHYIEILSANILSCETFDLKEYECRNHFKLHNYDGYKPNTKTEKGLCRFWYYNGTFDNNLIDELGIPIEYELNIAGNKGKKVNIDLISYDKNVGTIHLIEVKGRVNGNDNIYSSCETLLKCGLEIFTYYRSINKNIKQLINQLYESGKIDSKKVDVTLDVLVPNNNFYQDEANESKFPSLNKLLKKWGITVHFYDNALKQYK